MIAAWKNASAVQRILMMVSTALLALIVGFSTLVAIELVAFNAIDTRAIAQNPSQSVTSSDLAKRGEYLATLGNCAACHTDRGGAAYAGGKAINTPFGAVYASNITPDPQHGIGNWSADAFYRTMHQGVNAKGKLLTPAFPYANTTHIQPRRQ